MKAKIKQVFVREKKKSFSAGRSTVLPSVDFSWE